MLRDIDKINNRIKMMGIKRNHVAKQCDVSVVHLSRVINGKASLTDELKTRLFAYLGL